MSYALDLVLASLSGDQLVCDLLGREFAMGTLGFLPCVDLHVPMAYGVHAMVSYIPDKLAGVVVVVVHVYCKRSSVPVVPARPRRDVVRACQCVA